MSIDVERVFQDEVSYKKQAVAGIHSKPNRLGFRGKVAFASDLLTGKQKREYQKGGEVMTWNTNTILSREDLEQYTDEQKVNMIKEWRKVHSVKDIQRAWRCASGTFYTYLESIGYPKERQPRVPKKRTGKVNLSIAPVTEKVEVIDKKKEEPRTAPPSVFVEGLNFNLNGQYDSSTLGTWLNKLSLLIEDMDSLDVVIHIREKKSS